MQSQRTGHAKRSGGPQKKSNPPMPTAIPAPTTVRTRPNFSADHAPAGNPTMPSPPASVIITLAAVAERPTTDTAWKYPQVEVPSLHNVAKIVQAVSAKERLR